MKFSDHEFREVLLPSLSLIAYGMFSMAQVLIWDGLIKRLDRTDDFIIIMKLYQSYGIICVLLVYTLDLNDFSRPRAVFMYCSRTGTCFITGLSFYYINTGLGQPKEENNIWFRKGEKPCKCLVAWDCVKCFFC